MDINVTTPLNSLGYGQVGINVVTAMERAGYSPALWPIGHIEVTSPESAELLRKAASRTQWFNRDAPSLRIYHQFDLAHHVGRGLHAALPVFELNRFKTNEVRHLESQDIVFVASAWAKQIVEEHCQVLVNVAPFGVDTDIFRPTPVKNDGPTVFFNAGKWEVRKGHDLLLEAFNVAFGEADDVLLLMLSQNPVVPNGKGEQYNREWNQFYMDSKMGRAGKIRLLPRLATQQEVANVMFQADCGVFPSRAEGWNMELAEMMAMGKQVIATNYSAHTEYCTPDNCLLVEPDGLQSAYDNVWFHGQGEWANLGSKAFEQLVEHMRAVRHAKQESRLSFNQAGVDTFQRLTWDNTAKQIMDGLR